MQGITGTVQFAQFPGMTGTIYFNTLDLQRLLDVRGQTGATGCAREYWGSTGSTGTTGCVREYWGPTGATGRYVNVNYNVNANTSGKVVTEITF